MSETLITIVILAVGNLLFGLYHAWYVFTRDKQTREIMRAILSKDATEFTTTTLQEKPAKNEPEADPLYPVETMTDEAFLEHIQNQLKNK